MHIQPIKTTYATYPNILFLQAEDENWGEPADPHLSGKRPLKWRLIGRYSNSCVMLHTAEHRRAGISWPLSAVFIKSICRQATHTVQTNDMASDGRGWSGEGGNDIALRSLTHSLTDSSYHQLHSHCLRSVTWYWLWVQLMVPVGCSTTQDMQNNFTLLFV